MSLILDALRKMELERKAKRQSSAEIRAEVLYYHGSQQAPEKSRLLPFVGVLLLCAVAAVMYLYFKGSGPRPAAPVHPPASPSGNVRPQATVPQPVPLSTPAVMPVKESAINSASKKAEPDMSAQESLQLSADEKALAISGIAWQEEHALRRAVINGALVGEGAEISGAKVVEIRETLVRFSRRGRVFEVNYTSGR